MSSLTVPRPNIPPDESSPPQSRSPSITTSTSSLVDSEKEGSYAYDIVYENQRGAFVFGSAKFSAKMLNLLDPPAWSDVRNRFSASDLSSLQPPDPTWEWVHPEWRVDMTGDVDAEGWSYAFNFRASEWHGDYRMFRSFVRRRKWIRLRKRKGAKNLQGRSPTSPVPPSITLPTSSSGRIPLMSPRRDSWVRELNSLRLDREKLAYLHSYLQTHPSTSCSPKAWAERSHEAMASLDHTHSRCKAIQMLSSHLSPLNQQDKEAVGLEEDARSMVPYYSDWVALHLSPLDQ
ncbi:MAG: hypothetical protein DHS80DRAFT_30544 [Piptocephalis tieghemiana]|nr:MAG: hypothetical protein DHS80DRAFT_30544 [Piptocephalis tieghemiana]